MWCSLLDLFQCEIQENENEKKKILTTVLFVFSVYAIVIVIYGMRTSLETDLLFLIKFNRELTTNLFLGHAGSVCTT